MREGLAGEGDISRFRSGTGEDVTPRFKRLGGRRPGAGDAEESRLSGLRTGREDDVDRGVRPMEGFLRWGDGVTVLWGL